jgi:hypothetical protein
MMSGGLETPRRRGRTRLSRASRWRDADGNRPMIYADYVVLRGDEITNEHEPGDRIRTRYARRALRGG